MKKDTSKKGIAVISLVLIIIVLSLLTGMITYVSNDIISESKRTAFAKDTDVIYDAAQEYYAVNGDIPRLESGLEMDAATYKSNITDGSYLEALTEEIASNGDENAIFYEIDMTKIGIEDSIYGLKENEKDLYLISNVSNVIYYYPGIKINKDIYFSNSVIINK